LKFSNTQYNNSAVSILHLNIRSLSKNENSFLAFYSSLNFKFDIIVLTEIRKSDINFDNLLCSHKFHYNHPTTGTVGGVGIFIKNGLEYKIRDDLYLKTKENKIEDLWIEINLESIYSDCKAQCLIIGGIYRHPGVNISEFTQLIDININKVSCKKTSVMLIGDMNIDLLQFDQLNNVNEFFNTIIMHGFTSVITLPTRITKTSATLIDHIFLRSCNIH
jgi:exonuclease III